MAVVGLLAVVAIRREQAVGVYILYAVVLAYLWLIGRVVSHGSGSARWHLSLAGIATLLTLFITQSAGPTLVDLRRPVLGVFVILDMLLLLRMVVVLWEFGTSRIDSPPAVEFLAWCSLPFMDGGPLLRYSEFQLQRPWKVSPLPPLGRDWWAGVAVGVGMLAGAVGLAGIQSELAWAPWYGRLAIYYGTSPWGWYLLAAGLTGLLRQSGSLAGVTIPRNFDAPFRSRNLSDFWARWNITATNAFRDMLFYNRWGLRHPNLYLNSLIVFLVVGLWHAQNAYWVLWGLMHGIGFSLFILWRKVRGPGGRPLPSAVGWALTYVFVCTCWAAPPQMIKLFHRLSLDTPV